MMFLKKRLKGYDGGWNNGMTPHCDEKDWYGAQCHNFDGNVEKL